jgi:hypothetical protein
MANVGRRTNTTVAGRSELKRTGLRWLALAGVVRLSLLAAAAGALSLLAAGCGGASDTSGIAHLGSTTTTTGLSSARDPMAQAIKFAACMRKHGVPDFPDPRTSATGNVTLVVPDSPKAKAAQQTCRRLLPGEGAAPASEQAQRLASLLKYAQCMRKHGVTDYPDPDNQGEFPSTAGFNRSSPNYRAADKACLPLARGFVKNSGKGRG